MSRIGFVAMESDVSDVIYLTWLVDADTAKKLLPAGMRLWERDGKTLLTILTYRHGNFGPASMGRFRRILPSPMQSNWRLYLANEEGNTAGVRTVYFLKNIMDSALYAFGTRMFSDIMQTHLADRFAYDIGREMAGLDIRSGAGSAPELSFRAVARESGHLAPAFGRLFASWQAAVTDIALQDAAVCQADRHDRLVVAGIDLPIDVAQVLPFEVSAGSLECPFLDQFSTVEGPLCFVVPRVKFRVLSERLADIAGSSAI
jgi:uncharacterized protein YqjF (DUF2071 family)